MKKIEEEIREIKERNKRVELDKKWETSLTRKICIAVLTYIVVVVYSYMTLKIRFSMYTIRISSYIQKNLKKLALWHIRWRSCLQSFQG